METIKTNNDKVIRSWAPLTPDTKSAMSQMHEIAMLPFVEELCLMPDGHLGMDMCIGGVVSTKDVIVPNFVGVDIGCGMCALETNFNISDLSIDDKAAIFTGISAAIPTGFSRNTELKIALNRERFHTDFTAAVDDLYRDRSNHKYSPIEDLSAAFYSQLGTLGGGNHFIEIQADERGHIWIMIHSGSRNIGHTIAQYFNKIAIEETQRWHSAASIPFLPADSEPGEAYLRWMKFALDFAFLNRKAMMLDILEEFGKFFTGPISNTDGMINIHHNFASLEHHHGKNVWVHRKGATKATKGRLGIIPGSMGTSSYITRGLGNHLSLMSSSHGAGRTEGRMSFSRKMKDRHTEIEDSLVGVIHSPFGKVSHGKNKGMLDVSEAPAAYKDIDVVMENQKDLVEIVVKLKPLISVKG